MAPRALRRPPAAPLARPMLAAALLLASPRPAPAVVCSTAIDDAAQIRWGADFLSLALPAGANIADCIALCCATPGCQSFSFNVPPQQFAASATASAATARRGPPPSGLANCTPDNLVPCCRMKDAVPPLIANPYPETCQTGVLSNYTPPPSSGCVPPSPPTIASSVLANGRLASLDYHLAAGDSERDREAFRQRLRPRTPLNAPQPNSSRPQRGP